MDSRELFQPRGKTVGGSSSLNGMVFVRGHRLDFDGWAEEGAKGWDYESVLPFFRSIERYQGGANVYRHLTQISTLDGDRRRHVNACGLPQNVPTLNCSRVLTP